MLQDFFCKFAPSVTAAESDPIPALTKKQMQPKFSMNMLPLVRFHRAARLRFSGSPKRRPGLCAGIAALLLAVSCGKDITVTEQLDQKPEIFPDYSEVTVPPNIAPLNFSYLGDKPARLIVSAGSLTRQIKAENGLFSFPKSLWKELTKNNEGGEISLTVAVNDSEEWLAYKPFSIKVSTDRIDPYISYRLIPPGYQAWKKMGIYQRNLETYSQTAIFENNLTGGNCVNCHTYCQRDPSKMVFHARAEFGGTAMILDDKVEKLNTKTDSTVSALVYPYWHPDGKYVAFSVNKTNQNFFSHDPNKVEVYDSASDVVIYDVDTHEIFWSPLTRSESSFETFPTFSPDGRSLYFCTADAVGPMPQEYSKAKYSLVRIGFDPENATFGEKADTVYNGAANDRSVSFPRVSPDGKLLVFTLSEYGNFSIWHKDSDLWAANLETGNVYPLTEANSDDVESYHSWSGNSRWLVVASRRIDGLHTRPFFIHIDENGQASKPFLLPQKNPLEYYSSQMNSFNLPEFMSRKATVSKRSIATALRDTDGTDVKVRR